MNQSLILRTLQSPFPTPYNDITRGAVLSQSDVDNNFIYLKGQIIYTAQTSGNTISLNQLNGNSIQFTETIITGGTYISSAGTVTFTNDVGSSFSVSGFTSFVMPSLTGSGITNTFAFWAGPNSLTFDPGIIDASHGSATILYIVGTSNVQSNSQILMEDNTHAYYLEINQFGSGGSEILTNNTLIINAPFISIPNNTVITAGFTANTISATTYLNLPTDTDANISGGTFSNGTLNLNNSTGGTINITGFTSPNATNSLIGKKISVNFNATTDTIITLSGGSTFIITDIIITNANVNMSTAADGEWWTAASRTGTQIARTSFTAGSDHTISLLTSSSKYVNKDTSGGNNIVVDMNNITVGTSIYFSLATGQGSGGGATADMYIYGYILN